MPLPRRVDQPAPLSAKLLAAPCCGCQSGTSARHRREHHTPAVAAAADDVVVRQPPTPPPPATLSPPHAEIKLILVEPGTIKITGVDKDVSGDPECADEMTDKMGIRQATDPDPHMAHFAGSQVRPGFAPVPAPVNTPPRFPGRMGAMGNEHATTRRRAPALTTQSTLS